MSEPHPPHLAGSEASAARRLLAGKCLNKISSRHLNFRNAQTRSSALSFHCLRDCLYTPSLKISSAIVGCRSAPARCQSASASGPAALPQSPPAAGEMQNVSADSLTAPGGEFTNLNELYARLMLNCGLRVAGAMVLTAVPVFLLFKRPSARAFILGSVGGLVGGWQLHRADLIIRNPRENAELVPKAASLAECADEIQREWAETAKRVARFNWSNRS